MELKLAQRHRQISPVIISLEVVRICDFGCVDYNFEEVVIDDHSELNNAGAVFFREYFLGSGVRSLDLRVHSEQDFNIEG